jgi:excisionase family DNA binding protein
MDNNFLSVRQASDLLDVSERTITRQIKTGKLSATKSEKGSWQIEKSEFYRVYPEKLEKSQSDITSEISPSVSVSERHHTEITDMLKKQISLLEDQLRQSNKEKETILNTLQSNQRMLEHQAKPRRRLLGIF